MNATQSNIVSLFSSLEPDQKTVMLKIVAAVKYNPQWAGQMGVPDAICTKVARSQRYEHRCGGVYSQHKVDRAAFAVLKWALAPKNRELAIRVARVP